MGRCPRSYGDSEVPSARGTSRLTWRLGGIASAERPPGGERSDQAILASHLYRLLGHLADVLRDPHRAELGAAHRAELRRLEDFLRQRLVVHGAGGVGIQRQFELAVPVELEAGL